jgi:hypothetical protein
MRSKVDIIYVRFCERRFKNGTGAGIKLGQ